MEGSRRFGQLEPGIYPGSSYPKFQGDYRPDLIAEPSEDELETAGRQARIDQYAEEVIAIRDGEYRKEIYAGAEALVKASEFLGMKQSTSKGQRRLDVERSAWAIAGARTRENETAGLLEKQIRLLFNRATSRTQRRYLERRVVPVLYRAHGIVPPSPTR